MTATATPARDELVASIVPCANEALHLGHLLYAAEIAVTDLKDRLARADQKETLTGRTFPPKIRQRYKDRLAEAAGKRNRLSTGYRAALDAVRAVDPDTADLIDDAVWRINLFDVEPEED